MNDEMHITTASMVWNIVAASILRSFLSSTHAAVSCHTFSWILATAKMAADVSRTLLDHEPISWPIQSFTVDHDFKSADRAYLLLDRANAEFGLFYHIAAGAGVMAQLHDNEPVYFEVSRCRAACSRPGQTCRKVCVLMQHFQIDLEFATADHASDFLQSLGRLATKVGNMVFEVFEAQS
jgi:hypothetical protein